MGGEWGLGSCWDQKVGRGDTAGARSGNLAQVESGLGKKERQGHNARGGKRGGGGIGEKGGGGLSWECGGRRPVKTK